MPTYQYVCTECGGQIEAVQKFSDDPLTVHDACGGKLRKVFSPVGIVFKGSGFYRTDSRSGAGSTLSKPSASTSSDSGSDSGSGSSGSSSASSSGSDSGSGSGTALSSTPSGKDKASSGTSAKSGEKVA